MKRTNAAPYITDNQEGNGEFIDSIDKQFK